LTDHHEQRGRQKRNPEGIKVHVEPRDEMVVQVVVGDGSIAEVVVMVQ